MHPQTNTPAPDLARQLGISRDELKKIRAEKLRAGEDWIAGQPIQPILITESGRKKIRAALGMDTDVPPDPPDVPPDPPDEPDEPPAREAGPKRETLAVIRPARGNKLIVICLTEDGRTVNLKVKDNVNFIAGMQIPNCVQRPIAANQYDYEGRLPRRKGRF